MKYIRVPKRLRLERNQKYKTERDVTSCFENGGSHRSGRREKSVLVLEHTSVTVRCCRNEGISSSVTKEKQQTAPQPQTVIATIFDSLIN